MFLIRNVTNDSTNTNRFATPVVLDRYQSFQTSRFAARVIGLVRRAKRQIPGMKFGLDDLKGSRCRIDHLAQMLALHLGRRAAVESSSGIVDARNVAVHVARVNDVGCLLDYLAIVLFNSMAFDESGDFDEQF